MSSMRWKRQRLLAVFEERGNLDCLSLAPLPFTTLLLGLGFPAAAAIALDGDDLRVMNEAVDQCGGAGCVGEHRRPVRECEIRGEHQALLFVASTDDLEEKIGVTVVIGEIADLIHDEQRWAAILPKAALEPTC